MSLLAQLRAKEKTWLDAHPQIEAWGEAVKAGLDKSIHGLVDDEVSVAKQFASNAIAAADKAEAPVLNLAADAVGTTFAGAVSAYLGPAMGGMINAGSRDAIGRIRDGMIAEIHVLALQAEAMLAGNRAPAPAPAPSPTPMLTPAPNGGDGSI